MEECFICLGRGKKCEGKGSGRWLGPKAVKTLIKMSIDRGDSLYHLAEAKSSSDSSSGTLESKKWVLTSCYKKYTDIRQSSEDGSQTEDRFRKTKSTRGPLAYDYKTHCLICEELLDLDDIKKHPDRNKSKISEVVLVDKKNKCILHQTLKEHCRGKTDPVSMEVLSKLEYAPCIRAYEAKYHRDCMQRFLKGVSIIETKINKRNYNESKGELFQKFCEWYENNEHDTTSLTLFNVQKWMEDNSESEGDVYTVKQISNKLRERYGNEMQFTSSIGRPSIMLLREEADRLLTDTILEDTADLESGMEEFVSAGKLIRKCLLEVVPGNEMDENHSNQGGENENDVAHIEVCEQNNDQNLVHIHDSHHEEEDSVNVHENTEEVPGENTQEVPGNQQGGEEKFYPYASDLTLEELSSHVPLELSSFLNGVFPTSRSKSSERKKALKKIVIAHVIMQWCKREGYISPLLLSIGLFVHQVTRSRLLVDVLYALGLSLSYTAILDFEKCAAISTLEFKETLTENESQDIFLQFIADNFDHNEDTTTGANTTHVMGIISAMFPKSQISQMQPIMRKHVSSGKMIETADLRNLIKFYEKPKVSKFDKIVLKNPSIPEVDISHYEKQDTFWFLSSLFMENKPNWQGFMSDITHGTPLPSQIKFHPIVPLDPSSKEAVYSTLSYIKKQLTEMKICCTALTFDLPLHWKASEIIEDKSPEFDSIHLKLGGFHQLMSFLGAGCKLMEDAGLNEVWSTVYKENSIPKMMDGKAYSRCLRACLLTDSALHFTLLSKNNNDSGDVFEPADTFDDKEELIDLDGNIFESLSNDYELDEYDDVMDEIDTEKSIADTLWEKLKTNFADDPLNENTVEELHEMYRSMSSEPLDDKIETPIIDKIHEKLSDLKIIMDQKRTAKLWIQFMDFVSIVRMFVRAERTGNWKLHLYASEQMLPFLAAAGHNKYLKSVTKYLQDTSNLCNCLKKKYEDGLFTIWRKDKLFWSGTFTDQVIEQDLMLAGKSAGGLINITHKEAARTKWLLSAHVVANYSEALRDLTGVKTGTWSEQHRDMRLSQRREGHRHLRNFIDFFEVHNPFSDSSSELKNIATGVIANENVNVDNAIDIGKSVLNKIDGKCLSKISFKKKDQAVTFASMRKPIKVGDKEIRLSSDHMSQRLLASVRGQDLIPEVLSYELSAVAPSLFLDDGQMRKNNKAELMNELLPPGKVECFHDHSYHVFDGCAWLYNISWPKIGKIVDLYQMYLRGIMYESGSTDKITVCFDNYESESTKGPEQKRRKHGASATKFDIKLNTPIPGDRQKFMADKDNKQKLIDLFSSLLLQDGVVVKHALVDGDADTLIVKEALNEAHDSNVVVHSVDTDVFIALLHHGSEEGLHDIIMTTKKGLVSIKKVLKTIDNDLQNCLLFSHAISGCDTVSATFGIGKLKAYRKLRDSTYWTDLMKEFGRDQVDLDDLIAKTEMFVLSLYGKLGEKAESLNHLREIMYNLPKYIPITRMPPTSRSFHFHVLRAYLQVHTWMYLQMILDYEKYGFAQDNSGNIVPIVTDKPAAPDYLLKEIKCSCEKPNKAGLLCNNCGCQKARLPCTALCNCDASCDNPGY